jgi:hypothetical protein
MTLRTFCDAYNESYRESVDLSEHAVTEYRWLYISSSGLTALRPFIIDLKGALHVI